jgi:hypothetical protein
MMQHEWDTGQREPSSVGRLVPAQPDDALFQAPWPSERLVLPTGKQVVSAVVSTY